MIRTSISVLVFLLLGIAAQPAFAQQKIAYVDIAAIMKELPESQEAQRMLDAQVDKWQQELQEMEDEWQAKYNDYDKRKLILTDQGRAKAEKDLQELDSRIMQFRDQKFGQEGELFKLEDQIMRPIQDLVFDQVKNLGIELGYDYVLDKSGGVMIIYAKDDYDLTKKAIERIKTALPPRTITGQGQTGQGQGQSQPSQQGTRQTPPPPPREFGEDGSVPVRTPSDDPPPMPGK
ncbi:MAG: OmpH family outer membrane protein [Bacteroidetes bacterium]|nr:OmpH family outer membrane protein [Bacteroidota bacterium]